MCFSLSLFVLDRGRPTTDPTTLLFDYDELPICVDHSTTRIIPCPTAEENPMFDLVLQLLGLVPPRLLSWKEASCSWIF